MLKKTGTHTHRRFAALLFCKIRRRCKNRARPLVGELHTTYALDQVTALAKNTLPAPFAVLMATTFGFDIAPHTYFKLQKALVAGEVQNPQHRIMPTDNYPADYDNQDRTIRIDPAAVEHAIYNPDASWELLAILLHEFGHHLDIVLRYDLADTNADGTPSVYPDAPQEEGSRHAYRMAVLDSLGTGQDELTIATFIAPDTQKHVIRARYSSAMEHIKQSQTGSAQGSDRKLNDREGFEAGTGDENKHTHQTIEAVLGEVGLDKLQIQMAYFGNWMRDYSQLLDPKIVRATTTPKNFPDVLSREALTKIVDVMSVKKFGTLRSFIPEFYTVTPHNLGVYRPSQHIDNPKAINPTPADPKSRDTDFEPWVLPGDPLLEVDSQTSMKRYLQRSVTVMQNELRQGFAEKANYKGLKPFGAALHILEDFFAHSNFIELSLIKLGHTEVLPWTSKADCKWGLPLVTGTFGGIDIISSLAGPIGEVLFSTTDIAFKPTVSGERSERDKVMLILLSEMEDQSLLHVFEAFLATRDAWASLPISEYVEMYAWFTGAPAALLRNAFSTVMQGALRLIGNSIAVVQTHFGDDPNTSGSTDPSHSQLSKDHAEHPLHSLAALLAQTAVKQVAQAAVNRWNGVNGDDAVDIATAFFVHPMDSSWQDEIVKTWAAANPSQIRLAASKGHLDDVQKGLHNSAQQAFNRLKSDGTSILDFIFGGEENKESFYALLHRQIIIGPLYP